MKIYIVGVSNDHLSVLPCNVREEMATTSGLNKKPLGDAWKVIDYQFKAFRRSGKKKPDLRLLGGGGFAFRSELKDMIFPESCPELEFLPIMASGESWTLVNCLKTTSKYDPDQSDFFRQAATQCVDEDEEEKLLVQLAQLDVHDKNSLDFFRRGNGIIISVQKLAVYDSSLCKCALFTIEDSSRAIIFALPAFVERVRRLNLQGVTFTEIGVLSDDISDDSALPS